MASLAATKTFIVEATAKHTATIIFLHGLGDTGEGWSFELSRIKPSYAKLVCPTAPKNPVTINFGMKMPSWFDIRSLDKADNNEDIEGIKKASEDIVHLIQNEINGTEEKPGVPADRIILGGFSQGGALSIYTGLTGPIALAGIVSLSGYLPASSTINWSTIQKPPLFQCHGDSDPVVPYNFGVLTSKALESHLPHHKFKTYSGLGHSSSEEEMIDVKNFFAERIPPV